VRLASTRTIARRVVITDMLTSVISG
jgi:hypothetical protein